MEGGALTVLKDCPSTVTGVLVNNLLCRIQRFLEAVWKSDSMSCSMDAFSQLSSWNCFLLYFEALFTKISVTIQSTISVE